MKWTKGHKEISTVVNSVIDGRKCNEIFVISCNDIYSVERSARNKAFHEKAHHFFLELSLLKF